MSEIQFVYCKEDNFMYFSFELHAKTTEDIFWHMMKTIFTINVSICIKFPNKLSVTTAWLHLIWNLSNNKISYVLRKTWGTFTFPFCWIVRQNSVCERMVLRLDTSCLSGELRGFSGSRLLLHASYAVKSTKQSFNPEHKIIIPWNFPQHALSQHTLTLSLSLSPFIYSFHQKDNSRNLGTV